MLQRWTITLCGAVREATRALAAARPLLLAGVIGGVCLMATQSACDQSSPPTNRPHSTNHVQSEVKPRKPHYDLPQSDQRLCTAVALLIDTSGSMAQAVADRSGEQQPKHAIARSALERIVEYTRQWQQEHPDRTLQLGIYWFSSSPAPILPMAEFDAGRAQAAAALLPKPAGGTAIGEALETGFRALYASGCVRKYIVCVTDGENTSGPSPQYVARVLHEQTGGEVEIHFVAFDTSAGHFAFLKKVNGFVVEAADGAQLDARLADIYEKRILAEAPSAEEG